MIKSELIEKIAAQLNLPQGKAELLINCIFESMAESLRDGNRIELRGFGSFEIRRYQAYQGRNPRTGDPVGVNAKQVPFFKAGRELRQRVNAGTNDGPSAKTAAGKSKGKEPANGKSSNAPKARSEKS